MLVELNQDLVHFALLLNRVLVKFLMVAKALQAMGPGIELVVLAPQYFVLLLDLVAEVEVVHSVIELTSLALIHLSQISPHGSYGL